MPADPLACSLVDAAALIRRRDISSVELTTLCLERIARIDARLGAFAHVEPEAALVAARAADAALARGTPPGDLHGVPIARKDNIGRTGQRLTAGSRVFADRIAHETASVLAVLDTAGAVDCGATALSEFAFHVNGASSLAPPPRNPWHMAHIAGGSSGGSAAAVAAHCVFGALGTDSGGSIRSPASLCGIAGLMPTRGLVDRAGMAIGSATVDVIGPMARTVADCARLLGILAPSSHAEDHLASPLADLRIGLLVDRYALPATTRTAIEAAASMLAALGAAVDEVRWPDHETVNRHASTVFVHEVAHTLAAVLAGQPDDIHPEIRERLRHGLAIPEAQYRESMALRDAFTHGFGTAVLGPCDALLLPAAPAVAPRFDDVVHGTGAPVHGAATAVDPGRYTRAFNYLGLPALVLPAGVGDSGLPIGMQLVGRAGSDARLLQIGHQYQCATTWHQRVPTLV